MDGGSESEGSVVYVGEKNPLTSHHAVPQLQALHLHNQEMQVAMLPDEVNENAQEEVGKAWAAPARVW